jgi:L-lactate dehydrogenase complex protein LldG
MIARDEILGRVRAALTHADRSAQPVSRGYRRPRESVDLVELFIERVSEYRATVTRAADRDLDAVLASLLPTGARVLLPDGFLWTLPTSVTAVRDEELSPAELDAVEGVITSATVAIAETGTIVLSHGPGEGRRAVSLVPDLHICVVRTDQIIADVPDAVGLLDPDRPQTWISGPSATSDIELSRVEGVHGPRSLHVVLVS